MNTSQTVLSVTEAQALVTKSSARLDDVLTISHVTTEILEKFYLYWKAEVEASSRLLTSFSEVNPDYLPAEAIPHEVRRRHGVAREQLRLYQQEYELQSSLEEYEPA